MSINGPDHRIQIDRISPDEEPHGRVVVDKRDPSGIETRQCARVVAAVCDGLIAEASAVRYSLDTFPEPV